MTLLSWPLESHQLRKVFGWTHGSGLWWMQLEEIPQTPQYTLLKKCRPGRVSGGPRTTKDVYKVGANWQCVVLSPCLH